MNLQKYTQHVTKLKQDMDQLRQGVKSTLNTMLLDRDENTLEWANTFLDIPEIECIDINTILKKVNNTLLLNENAIETLFDSRKPTQSNSSN